MNSHHIINLAEPLLGTLTQAQNELFATIVDAVLEEITAQLRPGVELSQCEESLTLAAVLRSVSAMRKLMESDVSDFTAGTLRISLRSDHSVFAETADRLIAPWRVDGFAFRGVSG